MVVKDQMNFGLIQPGVEKWVKIFILEMFLISCTCIKKEKEIHQTPKHHKTEKNGYKGMLKHLFLYYAQKAMWKSCLRLL